MALDYKHDTHRVHLLLYHIVWCPKRRKPVLVGAIAERLSRILNDVASENGWDIKHLAIMPDHVHLFVRANPTIPVHNVVRLLKGRSSRLLRTEFSSLLRLPSLWTRSYFCATAGNVSAATIQRYIAAQAGT